MSNYKWLKLSENQVELRKEDFSLTPSFEVNEIDPILMKKLEENGIDTWLNGDGIFETCRYVLNAFNSKVVKITAPLYEYSLDTGQYVLLSEEYTSDVIDPKEYEWVKKTYFRCVEEVKREQANIFDKLFEEKSLDGISSVVMISSNFYKEPDYFYEQYIPNTYIKVCQQNCPFTRDKCKMVFIKKMNAKGQVVNIKIEDRYKGLVIGKGGENIKKIAQMINSKRINVI